MKKIILACMVAMLSSLAFGHSGGLDSARCHNDTRTGGYHCH